MDLLFYHLLSIDSTTGAAILVVSLLVIVLLLIRTYHKRIESREKTIAQTGVSKADEPIVTS